MKQVQSTERHFSKIVSPRYTFSNDAKSYAASVVRFKVEMENYGLHDVLHKSLDNSSSWWDVCEQKTFYHMLLLCVPAQAEPVITVALPEPELNAYGAWKALRRYYIGDEKTHLQALETRFSRIKWEEDEKFAAFEARFESVVNELAHLGAPKLEHVKRSGLMAAIQESNKKDARGNHVFDRLNTVSEIHHSDNYANWLTAMRTEAQKIYDAAKKESIGESKKRSREEIDDEHKHEVSFVGSTGKSNQGNTQQDRKRTDTRTGNKALCRGMLSSGHVDSAPGATAPAQHCQAWSICTHTSNSPVALLHLGRAACSSLHFPRPPPSQLQQQFPSGFCIALSLHW
jgi:hypothetical protein